MADKKISETAVLTTPTAGCLIPIVDVNEADIALKNKVLLYGSLVGTDGWTPVTGTFSWASASTITISAGGAAVYNIGDRLKWVTATGSTQRYGTVVGVANTLLTVAVNTSHVLVNETWTLPFYSHQESPVGYPDIFVYTSTPTGFSSVTTNNTSFSIKGRFVTLDAAISGVSNATTFTLTLPVTAINTSAAAVVNVLDNNVGSLAPTFLSAGVINFYKGPGGLGFTNSGIKALSRATFIYQI